MSEMTPEPKPDPCWLMPIMPDAACPIFDELFTDLALMAVLDAMHGVDDFLYLCGEDA